MPGRQPRVTSHTEVTAATMPDGTGNLAASLFKITAMSEGRPVPNATVRPSSSASRTTGVERLQEGKHIKEVEAIVVDEVCDIVSRRKRS